MKIKKDFDLSKLLDFGFKVIDKEYEEECEHYEMSEYDYKFDLGYARRGQNYWLLVNANSRNMSIIATKPDGDGCGIPVKDIFIVLIENDVVEKDENTD